MEAFCFEGLGFGVNKKKFDGLVLYGNIKKCFLKSSKPWLWSVWHDSPANLKTRTSSLGAYICRNLRFLFNVCLYTFHKKPRFLLGLHPIEKVLNRMNFTTLSPHELAKKLEIKELSSEEITKMYLERIKQHDSDIHAFFEVFDDVLDQARLVDHRRAQGDTSLDTFAGLPLAVKSLILVKGKKTTGGSHILENYVASYDATAIARLRQAGLVCMGTTNMDEFGMGSSTENSAFGPTKNPWNREKIPGGSSGGSAAAVAAGFVPLALGSDTGGSTRQPASLCGIVGLKPTYGRISRHGLIALASSFDQIGAFAKDVSSVAHLLRLMEGKDPKDATSANLSETTIDEFLQKDIKGMRIGIPKEYFLDGMDTEIKKAVMASVNVFEEHGALIKEISLPHTPYALATYYLILFCEASSNLARLDGMRYGFSKVAESLTDVYEMTRGH